MAIVVNLLIVVVDESSVDCLREHCSDSDARSILRWPMWDVPRNLIHKTRVETPLTSKRASDSQQAQAESSRRHRSRRDRLFYFLHGDYFRWPPLGTR